jgi:hypothetical protein
MTDSRYPPSQDSDPWGFPALLEELAKTKSGVSFIYSALELLANVYQLNDALVILSDEAFNSQLFRLGGKAVTADVGSRFEAPPGVYCDPPVVSDEDREAVHFACQRAFARHLEHFNAARDLASAFASAPSGPRATSDVFLDSAVSHPAFDWRGLLDDVKRRLDLREKLRSQWMPSPRVIVSTSLLLADLLIFVMTVGDVHGPIRFILGLILGLAIPGWSIVGLLGLDNAPLEIGLTLAVSTSLLIVVAQLLITFHLWHPIVLEEVTCLVCLPPLIWQSDLLRQFVSRQMGRRVNR